MKRYPNPELTQNHFAIIVPDLGSELWPEQGEETPLGAALMRQSPLAPKPTRC